MKLRNLIVSLGSCLCCVLGAVPQGVQAEAATATNAVPSAEDLALRDPFRSLFTPPKPVQNTATTQAQTPPPIPSPTPPPEPTASVPVDHSAEMRAALCVQGFVRQGDRRYAMVNGSLVTVGDVIQVRSGAVTARFRVREIGATRVEFDPLP